MKGSLKQISPDDYVLQDGMGAWVGVGNLDVRIRTFEGEGDHAVEVAVYPRHHADLDSLGGCSASCSQAKVAGGRPQDKASAKGGKGNLVKGKEAPEDYDMHEDADSVWIGYKEIDIHIKRTDEGVVVDLWPHVEEYSQTLDSTWVLFTEGEMDEEEDQDYSKDKLFAEALVAVWGKVVADARALNKPGAYPDSLYVGCLDPESESGIKPLRVWLLPKQKAYKELPPEQKGPVITEWYKKQPFYMSSSLVLVLCEETGTLPNGEALPKPVIRITSIMLDGRTPVCIDTRPFDDISSIQPERGE